jgi:hypothetical protein
MSTSELAHALSDQGCKPDRAEDSSADAIRNSLTRTAERCREVERLAGELASLSETLEHELVALAEEAGKLNASLAPHRQQRSGP